MGKASGPRVELLGGTFASGIRRYANACIRPSATRTTSLRGSPDGGARGIARDASSIRSARRESAETVGADSRRERGIGGLGRARRTGADVQIFFIFFLIEMPGRLRRHGGPRGAGSSRTIRNGYSKRGARRRKTRKRWRGARRARIPISDGGARAQRRRHPRASIDARSR